MYTNQQIEFYRAVSETAVHFDDVAAHLVSRDALYNRHLRIPRGFWAGKTVLEFGPNGGENALYVAQLGARLTLVEPMAEAHEVIRRNFSVRGLEEPKIIQGDIAEFRGACGHFDVCIAEGFLPVLDDRLQIIERTISAVTPEMLIVSFSSRIGSIFEILRRSLARHIVFLFSGCADGGKISENLVDYEKAVDFLVEFFSKDFQRISSTRNMRNWVLDGLLNPIFSEKTHDDLRDWLSLLESSGYSVNESSPYLPTLENRRSGLFYKRDAAAVMQTGITPVDGDIISDAKHIKPLVFGEMVSDEYLVDGVVLSKGVLALIDAAYKGDIEKLIRCLEFKSGSKVLDDIFTRWKLIYSEVLSVNQENLEGSLRRVMDIYNQGSLIEYWGVPAIYLRADRR
jgi:hypothetical protein